MAVDLEGLAVDTATEKLYFSDGGSDPKIVEIDLLDRDREQRIIVSGKNLKPRALVIDEANRYVDHTGLEHDTTIMQNGETTYNN